MTFIPHQPATPLRCSEAGCGTTVARDFRGYLCPTCGNLLEAVANPGSATPDELRHLWKQRRTSNHTLDASGVWRFREFLPDTPADAVVTLFEGNVPLLPGRKTASYAG